MFQIVEASENLLAKWDSLVDQSVNGTIFHYQNFLAYHKDRFKDQEKHLVIVDGSNPLAQISLAVEKKMAKSPYGGSYGGFILNRALSYREGKELVNCFIDYLQKAKIGHFKMIMPPAFCVSKSLDTFYFNLLENGFKLTNRDISSVVCFNGEPVEQQISTRGRRMAKKALTEKVEIQQKGASLPDFYRVMTQTFKKHGQNPTHSEQEFGQLMKLLPGKIHFNLAYKDKKPIAAIGVFKVNNRVDSSFYLCQDPAYQDCQGLSLLALETLKSSQSEGFSFFDFGTSSVDMVARENIFSFKENYSKIGYFRDTYEWSSRKN